MVLSILRCVLAVLTVVTAAVSATAGEKASQTPATPATPAGAGTPNADDLIEAALNADLLGDRAERQRLLAQAIKHHPDSDRARWQSGQVEFEGQWRTPAEVAACIAADRRWQTYDELRQASDGSSASHLELARWCFRNGLTNEERYHWANVLLADPEHSMARARLKVRKYRGGLATQEQIDEYERGRRLAEQNMAAHKPVIVKIVRGILEGDAESREIGLAQLRGVTNPNAMDALEKTVARACETAPAELAVELKLAMIAALTAMPQHDATMKLLNHSVFAKEEEVRAKAAEGLKPRPVTDYVPLLMAALSAPIEGEVETFTAADGTVLLTQQLYQAGPEADVRIKKNLSYVTVAGISWRGRVNAIDGRVMLNRMEAASKARAVRSQVAAINADSQARNDRIREVLKSALDIDLGTDAKAYWQAWSEYNELYSEDHPTYTYSGDYTRRYYVPPPPSCFALGTPVWTQAGPKSIERITVGDLVLSQNPVTGELGYRAVTQTTVRPPSKMIHITLPDDQITATLGHRFWVSGKGWEMAKLIEPAAALHSLQGGLQLQAKEILDESTQLEAYNLVVDDFHTYFVGQSQLLVHDNSCPRPVQAVLPGASPELR